MRADLDQEYGGRGLYVPLQALSGEFLALAQYTASSDLSLHYAISALWRIGRGCQMDQGLSVSGLMLQITKHERRRARRAGALRVKSANSPTLQNRVVRFFGSVKTAPDLGFVKFGHAAR